MYYFRYFLFGAAWTAFLIVLTFVRIPFELFNGDPLLVYFNEVSFKTLYSATKDALAQDINKEIVNKIPEKEKSKIDGITELEEGSEGEQVIALMVENHPDSRAQMAGLSKASIIYETEAEGGITRFLAIFNKFDAKKVGPIRSARPYFVDFVEEYSATYGHAGGSDLALKQVQSGKILNAEALYYESFTKYFYRDNNYYAPHNLFANLTELTKLSDKKEWTGSVKERFKFINNAEKKKEDTDETIETADHITADFSRKLYKAEYFYDAETETYLRHMSEKKHIDHDGQVTFNPSNILVQFTEYKPYDSYGRLTMRTTGSGDAILFSRGRVFQGKWEKKDGDITRFTDSKGKDFKLTPGQTWIEVIKPGLVSWENMES